VLYAALADPFRIAPSAESASDGERGALGLSAPARDILPVADFLQAATLVLCTHHAGANSPQIRGWFGAPVSLSLAVK
jgi:hypothetical protein